MHYPATARAEAEVDAPVDTQEVRLEHPLDASTRIRLEHSLEAAAQALKRQLGTSRRALQSVRQAQQVLIGIESDSQEEIEDGNHSASR